MYIIYKHNNNNSTVIGVCHTKVGAERACRHFFKEYSKANGHTSCRVDYQQVDSYMTIRVGYAMLQMVRKWEEKKLHKLRGKRNYQEKLYDAQARKVASLY